MGDCLQSSSSALSEGNSLDLNAWRLEYVQMIRSSSKLPAQKHDIWYNDRGVVEVVEEICDACSIDLRILETRAA